MSSLPVPDQGGGHPSTGSRCASCTAPLAADQLFCLSCGARRRDARIPFRDVLATEATPVVTAGGGAGGPVGWGESALPVGAGPGPLSGAGSTPLLGMALCLLLALGLGVWIGRGQEAPATAAAPVYAAPTQALAATTPVEAVATTPEDEAATDDVAAKDDDKKAADAPEVGDEPAAEPSAALKALEGLSPEEYQKQAAKLTGSAVGTGGKAPPKDDKPAGGGSEFEDFQ